MKKSSITATMAVVSALTMSACDSQEERIRKAQIETCQDDFHQGKEVTRWCADRVPELRQYLAPVAATPPAPQYVEQAPVQYAPQPQQPVIVNQPAPAPAQSNGMTDILVGGLIGHAIGSAGSSAPAQVAPSYSRPQYSPAPARPLMRSPEPVPAQAPAPVPKKNYMDTSKLNSYGARPSAPAKPSSMNMGKLSSSGKR